MAEFPHAEVERSENIATFESEGVRYRVLYEAHSNAKLHRPQDLGNSHAVFYELMTHHSLVNFAEFFKRYTPEFSASLGARKQFFVDFDHRMTFSQKVALGDTTYAIAGAEAVAALGLAYKAVASNPTVTRRLTLGLPAAALLAKTATYGVQELNDSLTIMRVRAGERLQDTQAEQALRALNETINPEIVGVSTTLRNYLWAYHTKQLIKEELKGPAKPEVAIICGKAHSGVEQALMLSEAELLSRITRFVSTIAKFGVAINGMSMPGMFIPEKSIFGSGYEKLRADPALAALER